MCVYLVSFLVGIIAVAFKQVYILSVGENQNALDSSSYANYDNVMMDINNKGRFAKSFPSISSSNKLKSASAANTEQWGPNHKAY